MKVIIYNTENIEKLENGKPFVRVNNNSGAVSFNRLATHIIKKTGKKYIQFCQDELRPADWYVMPTDHEKAFIPRTDADRESYVIQCKALTTKILNSCGISSCSVRMMMAGLPTVVEGEELYAIITKSSK